MCRKTTVFSILTVEITDLLKIGKEIDLILLVREKKQLKNYKTVPTAIVSEESDRPSDSNDNLALHYTEK